MLAPKACTHVHYHASHQMDIVDSGNNGAISFVYYAYHVHSKLIFECLHHVLACCCFINANPEAIMYIVCL